MRIIQNTHKNQLVLEINVQYKTRNGKTVYGIRKAKVAKGYFIDLHKEYVLGRASHVFNNGKYLASGLSHPLDILNFKGK